MNTSKNLLIFSGNDTMLDYMEYMNNNSEYNLIGIALPKEIKNKTQCSFDEMLTKCDFVLFTELDENTRSKSLLKNNIFKAINMGKNIICSISLEDADFSEIEDICNKKGLSFFYTASPYEKKGKEFNNEIERAALKAINTPVIFVIGTSEQTQKFHIQLALREQFKNKGYRVSQVGTKNFCKELLNFRSFPSFMFSNNLSETSKIILFNHFIRKMELEEKPDIIIVGIPGGIIPLDDRNHNKFGITAYEVSQAVSPDAVIMTTLYEEYYPEYFHHINEVTKYKLGYEIDCFNLSTYKLNWPETQMTNTQCYLSVDVEFVNKRKSDYSQLGRPVFCIKDKSDHERMANFIIDKLSEYASTGIVI